MNDLATVFSLGWIFSPFAYNTLILVAVFVIAFTIAPWFAPWFLWQSGNRPLELEAPLLLMRRFALGPWPSGPTANRRCQPLLGMVLAGTVGEDHAPVRPLCKLTIGILAPSCFLRAGAFVSVLARINAPGAIVVLLQEISAWKIGGVNRDQGSSSGQ